MKKVIITIVSAYLFSMMLLYSGLFLNHRDPLAITRYYFECLSNREGFLTHSITKRENFYEDKEGRLFDKYKMQRIKKLELALISQDDNFAQVEIKMIYKDDKSVAFPVRLEMVDNEWLILDSGLR